MQGESWLEEATTIQKAHIAMEPSPIDSKRV
jgi:hypothetical protein